MGLDLESGLPGRLIASDVHGAAVGEFVEWVEDVTVGRVGACAVFLDAPHRWGRTTVLSRLVATVEESDASEHAAAVVGLSLGGVRHSGPEEQARRLTGLLAGARLGSKSARLLQRVGLGSIRTRAVALEAGLLISEVAGASIVASPLLPVLPVLLAVGAGVKSRYASTSGAATLDAARRCGYELSRLASGGPVVVVVDDLDALDTAVAVRLVESMMDWPRRKILLVASIADGSDIVSRLRMSVGAERISRVSPETGLDTEMDAKARRRIVLSASNGASAEAMGAVVRNTSDFADVFAVLGSPRASAALAEATGTDAARLCEEMVSEDPVSRAAFVVAALGGAVPVELAAALGVDDLSMDPRMVVIDGVARLRWPLLPDEVMRRAWRHFGDEDRDDMCRAVLAESPAESSDAVAVAWARCREAAADRVGTVHQLAASRLDLAEALHKVGSAEAAAHELNRVEEVAQSSSADLLDDIQTERLWLLSTQLRALGAPRVKRSSRDPDGRVFLTPTEEVAWRAIDALLAEPDTPSSCALARAACKVLDDDSNPSDWLRLLIARHLEAAEPDLTQQLLRPLLLLPADDPRAIAANDLLEVATSGTHFDARLQMTQLQRQLQHSVEIQGQDHPETLTIRHSIADCASTIGNYREALGQFTEILPHQILIRGKDHPDTLATRYQIAEYTGLTGNAREALKQLTELLPDKIRIIGEDHPDTLATRHYLAEYTGLTGNAREALKQLTELLPDRIRIIGEDHPDTLATRHYLAEYTGLTGNARDALKQFTELLPDQIRALGKDHRNTLATRHYLAEYTGLTGNARDALKQFSELLPDKIRIRGKDHRNTLATRYYLARYTGLTGNARDALKQFTELLPDKIRIIGEDHPHTLATRHYLAEYTGLTGNARDALKQFTELLPDQIRALGKDHRNTLATRHSIAEYTGYTDDLDDV